MDSNDIECECGIIIFVKVILVEWKGICINIVDIFGYVDFGGEVECILLMVDGVCLLVDVVEGLMLQMKFVILKVLVLGLKFIVVLNKVDKLVVEFDQVLDQVFDFFVNFGVNDEQLDFLYFYVLGIGGWVDEMLDGDRKDMFVLFDLVLCYVEQLKQVVKQDELFQMLVIMLGLDNFLGCLLIGWVEVGCVKVGDIVKVLLCDGEWIEQFCILKVLVFCGLIQILIDEVVVGDIVMLVGMVKVIVVDILVVFEVEIVLFVQFIDLLIISVMFGINDSLLVGCDGNKV